VHRLWKVGEWPLYANHLLRPFAFFLGRAFKLAIAKSASGCMPINIYVRRSLSFLGVRLSWLSVRKIGAVVCQSIFTRAVRFLLGVRLWLANLLWCVRGRDPFYVSGNV
jgi:hypothetical protein